RDIEIINVDLPEEGEEYEKDDIFGSIESVEEMYNLIMPVSGVIVSVNEKVLDNIDLLNEDPYEEGWLANIRVEEPLTKAVDSSAAAEKFAAINAERGVACLETLADYRFTVFGETCENILTQVGDFISRYLKVGESLHVITTDPATEVDMIAYAERTGHKLLEIKKIGKLLHVIYMRAV
ncbi:MAG: sulfurtransferase TusA family protein, partial [Candidatus Caldarchaeum sp.]